MAIVLKRFFLLAPITVLLFILQSVWVNFPVPFAVSFVVAQTSDLRKAEADRLVEQGIEQAKSSRFEAALESFQAALIIYQEIGNQLKVANTLNRLGIAYFSQGKYQKAKEFHEQSLVIAKKIGSREEEAKSLNGLGNTLSFLRQHQKAIESHEQSLVIARSIGSREEEVKSFNGLGNAYVSLEQYEKAIKLYEQSLVIAREIGYKEGEAKALTNLGGVYYSQRRYEKAIEFLEQSLAITREVKDIRIEAVTLNNLGQIYQFLGRYQKAIESDQQALATYRAIGNREGEMMTLRGLGIAYRNLEQYQKAIEFHQQSLVIAKELGNRQTEAVSYGNLGVANYFLGRYQKAIEFHEQALTIYRQLPFKEGVGLTLGNLGLAYSSLGEYQKAIELYQESLVIARELGDKLREGNALNNIGGAYIRLGQYANASTTLLEAIGVYETIRLSGLTDTNKISIFDTYSRSYRLLQQAFILQNKPNNALETAERGRARAFVELLSSQLSPDPKQQSSINLPSIEQIQQIAKTQNATLVEYSIIESELYIWVIKPTGEVTFRKADLKPLWQSQNTSLEDLVSATRESIGVDDRTAVDRKVSRSLNEYNRSIFDQKVIAVNEDNQAKNLQQLHQLLIAPIADILPTDPNQRVIFIPQGELFLVPFPALQDKQGKYLIEKHTILTSPSIQVLELTQKQRQRVKQASVKDVIVVGNPTMPSVPPKYGEKAQPLSKLPGAEREALAIAPILNTKALTGNEATKAAVLARLPQAKIIHLATHGLLDDFQGLQSAVALAPSGNDNGLLTADEIFKLKLNADLVVLSACNTGRGRISGDGVIGLSRSLITAGTPSVIVSLWSVPDAPTAELMTDFYTNLYKKRLDKAQALREAMLKLKDKDPKNWAAFTLIGEAE